MTPTSTTDRIIRPAAVINEAASRQISNWLDLQDVSKGGIWSASPSTWQRFDQKWDGPSGMRGRAQLVGSIYVIHNSPQKYWVTLYRVQVTEWGSALGLTVDGIADEVLSYADLTLASCPRDDSMGVYKADPFKSRLPGQ